MEEAGGELWKELQECKIWRLTRRVSRRKLRQWELDTFPWLGRIISAGVWNVLTKYVITTPLLPRPHSPPACLLLLHMVTLPTKTWSPALPVPNLQPALPHLCSMTTRSRLWSCWGPKLKANLRARSLISMKAGSSVRPWGPCSCISSVYSCVPETRHIWKRWQGVLEKHSLLYSRLHKANFPP